MTKYIKERIPCLISTRIRNNHLLSLENIWRQGSTPIKPSSKNA